MRRIVCWLLTMCLALSCAAGVAQGTVTPSEPDKTAQGWVSAPGAEERIYGDLADLVALAPQGKIYVQTDGAVRLKEIDARTLADIAFLPDPDAFVDGEYIVRITLEDPDRAEDLAGLTDVDCSEYADMEQEQILTLYVWVMQVLAPTHAPTVTPEPQPTPEPVTICVQAKGVQQGEWVNSAPEFRLSGIPEGEQGLAYAVILYDREIIALEGNNYTAETEGVYSLRFVILDAMGDIVSASESVTVYVDTTAPETVSVLPSQQKSYALVVTAADSLSGVCAVSTDGGETWSDLADEQPWGYAFGKPTSLAPGMLCVRDGAGNIWTNEEEILLGAIVQESSGGGGYSGVYKPHAENTTGNDGATGYAQAELASDGEPVDTLEISGRQIGVVCLQDGEEPVAARLSVSFTKWIAQEGDEGGLLAAHTGEKTQEDDVLVLRAVLPEEMEGESPAFVWNFDGAALRTLYLSGVNRLVCLAGESAAVFPTAGFTAGTDYTRLKIGGVGSRYFVYSVSMRALEEEEAREADPVNQTHNCEFVLQVDVQGESWQMLPAQDERMMALDVYCVPAEYLEMPMAQWNDVQNAQ